MKSAMIIYFGRRNSNARFGKCLRNYQIRRIKGKLEKLAVIPKDILLPPEDYYIREVHISQFFRGILIRLIWAIKGK